MTKLSEKSLAQTTPAQADGAIPLVSMTVADFAQKAQKPLSEVIMTLLRQGIVAAKNQVITEKVVAQLAQTYELAVVQQTKVSPKETELVKTSSSQEGTWQERLPIAVVIGHVDHGKTTLLDFIRKTRVAAKEKGGITQHLGAYEVKTAHGNIIFLDTPGHEAFSMMRVRGLKVADIAILVIAGDDGVMPQTVEAINRAKAVGLPIIIAINKIDKATPMQLETVKRQLAQHDLLPEDWGGQTVCIPISAKLGTGIDELLEVLSLQAQLLDLKANISVPAQGYVLESKLEKGRGPVATVICLQGILKVGDYFSAGVTSGKISSLTDYLGVSVKSALPAMPVSVAGFDAMPQAGDIFQVVSQETHKKGATEEQLAQGVVLNRKKSSTENAINILLKADNASSREALINSIDKISAKLPRQFYIVASGIGNISESDVELAADTHSTIYGFHVKTSSNAQELLQRQRVIIKHFDIIYKLLEDLEAFAEAGKPIKMVSKKIGEATVLKVFDIKGLGIVAGAVVRTGRFIRDGKVIIWRGKHKVGEGSIKGLQRDKKSVKEVHAGFECGFLVDGFDTWLADDRVECYQEVPA